MPPHERANRNLRLLYTFWFLRDFQVWIPVWIVFLTEERGFSLTDVTIAEGLFLVGCVALEVPTGAVADRWGRSRSLALGALFLGVSVLIFAFTTSFAILLTSFMLWSVASTLTSGADMALLFDTLKAAGDEGSYERHAGRGHAFVFAGAGIATFLGGPLAALLDIRATILIGAATCLVTALVAFLMWEPQHEATTSAPRARYWATIGSAFREVWHNRAVRAVVLLTGTVFASLEAVMYLIQPYLLDRGIEIGVVFSMLQVPTLIAGAAGALLASRVHGHARLLMLALPACGVAAYIALALGPGLSAYAAFPLMYLFASCLMPLATGQINRNIGSAQRATILSIHGMVASLLLAALAPAVGFTTDNQGLPQAFALGAGVTLVSLVLFGSMLVGTRGASAESAAMPAPADV